MSISDPAAHPLAAAGLASPAPAIRRWNAWIVAHLHAVRIDRELADGVASWSSPSHAARSRQLTTRHRRRALAGCIERLLEDVDRPATSFPGVAIAPCRIQVREAKPQLLEIADRLRDGAPVGAGGVASLYHLLRDGGSPCYVFSEPAALSQRLRAVGVALDAPA